MNYSAKHLPHARQYAANNNLSWQEPPEGAPLLVSLSEDATIIYDCPGCQMPHGLSLLRGAARPSWMWNGSMHKPTLSPSILSSAFADRPCCHHFVRDGVIEFLNDCTHALRGQKVAMQPIT